MPHLSVSVTAAFLKLWGMGKASAVEDVFVRCHPAEDFVFVKVFHIGNVWTTRQFFLFHGRPRSGRVVGIGCYRYRGIGTRLFQEGCGLFDSDTMALDACCHCFLLDVGCWGAIVVRIHVCVFFGPLLTGGLPLQLLFGFRQNPANCQAHVREQGGDIDVTSCQEDSLIE